MPYRARIALLAASLLSACAAAPPQDGAGGRAPGLSGQYLTGHFAMSRTDLQAAADALLRVQRADPQDRTVQEQAFTAAVLSGRPEALGLARLLSGNPAATLVLADASIKAGDWHAAQARFNSLPSQVGNAGGTQVLRPLLLAWAQQGAGNTDEALGTLRPLVEGTRYRGVYALHAAMINDLAGRQAEAGRLYRVALVEYGALNLRLGVIVASWQARNGQANEARGTIHAMAAASPDLAIAEPALQQAVATRAVSSAADGVAEAYFTLAANLQQQDAPDFAMLLLHLGLDMRSGFTPARLLAADISALHGQASAASALLASVPATDPLIAVVRLRLALYAGQDGRIADAQALLDRLAAEYPNNPQPLALLAGMQRSAGRFMDAADTYGRAIGRVKQPARADWILFYEQGVSYDRAHDWPKAEADLLHALALSPDEPVVLNYLGYAWAEQGHNLPRARQMLEHAVEQRPNDGSIVDSLGWVLLRLGDRPNAVRFLERAVELQSEDATINSHLGDAYMAAGRRREAEVQWRRALILNPEPQDERSLQAKLSGAAPAPPAVTVERRVE